MQILNENLQMNKPDFYTLIQTALNKNNLNLNCVRIGIIQEFIAAEQVVKVKIASQKVLRVTENGEQVTRDYAPIYAKLCYANPYITFPPKVGDECVLLFNDREMESWWINGQANQQLYNRMHDLTDCIAICGMRSKPRLITILENCLHFFFGNSSFQIYNENVVLNSENIQMNGTVGASHIDVEDGATGSFISKDDKTITVNNGIITGISQ